MLDTLGQLDEEDIAEQRGEFSTATWLKRELNLPPSTAYEYLRVARGLRRFRLLFETFRSGVMPYNTMRFLLKFMHEENEEELIDLALIHAFSELERILAGTDTVAIGPADLDLGEGTNTIVYAWGSAEDENLALATQVISGLHEAPTGVPGGEAGLVDDGSPAVPAGLVLGGLALLAGLGVLAARRQSPTGARS